MKTLVGGSMVCKPEIVPDAIKEMASYHGNVIQLFIRDPTMSYRVKSLTDQLKNEIKNALTKYKMELFIHSPYTINMSKSLKDNKASFNALKSEMEWLSKITNTGCVVHMGKTNTQLGKISDKDAIKNQMEFIKAIIKETPDNVNLILETAAGQGSEILSNFDNFLNFYHSIPSETRKRVKICIDTCHIFQAGNDILTQKKTRELFNKVEMKDLILVHLNDSLKPFYSRVDRHADIGCGQIPLESLNQVIKICKKNNIPMILEKQNTFCKDYSTQFKYIYDLN